MVRVKKIKSGKKYYYYIVEDIYDRKIGRGTTKLKRKATKEEIEEYERKVQLKKKQKELEEKKPIVSEIRIYQKDNQIKILQYENYNDVLKKIEALEKQKDKIDTIKIDFLKKES
ncbi:MAG: hypothetical protein HWN67_03650 [Candidatus Helarchaeota archaeon]|nr:hypothetical protein [Candidatus Helarchaeota archaeon]